MIVEGVLWCSSATSPDHRCLIHRSLRAFQSSQLQYIVLCTTFWTDTGTIFRALSRTGLDQSWCPQISQLTWRFQELFCGQTWTHSLQACPDVGWCWFSTTRSTETQRVPTRHDYRPYFPSFSVCLSMLCWIHFGIVPADFNVIWTQPDSQELETIQQVHPRSIIQHYSAKVLKKKGSPQATGSLSHWNPTSFMLVVELLIGTRRSIRVEWPTILPLIPDGRLQSWRSRALLL